MKLYNILFRQTGFFSDLFCDYLDAHDAVRHFYKYPLSYDIIPRIIEEKQMQTLDRKVLSQTIKNQYKSNSPGKKVEANIVSLLKDNTFTITTAHQPNLFTGPLYFIIKILSAINLAKELSIRYPDYCFVPVYWMGGEDHDFEEINHVKLYDNKLAWEKPDEGPVGRLNTDGIKKVLDALGELVGKQPFAEEWIRILGESYLNNSNLAEATRYLVNHLFGEAGLVVVDGDDKEFKNLFAPIIQDELKNRSSAALIEHTLKEIAVNYKAQVDGREINLFYLGDHSRDRIVFDPKTQQFEVLNRSLNFTLKEILEEAKSFPEKFSPNVILRPVYQELILPNLAFVGGSSEIAYWLELEKLFEHHRVNFPMLVPRNSVMIIEKPVWRKMQSANIGIEDIFKEEDLLIREYVQQNAEGELSLSGEGVAIKDIFKQILEKALEIDITLEKTVRGEEQRILNSLNNLEAKMLKGEKRKFEIGINQIKSARQKLFPDGGLQERHENITHFYIKFGPEFIQKLAAAIKPIERQFLVMVEDQ